MKFDIKDGVLHGCKRSGKKDTVVIPGKVHTIGERAFSWHCLNCLNLRRMILPEHLRVIEEGAFRSCAELEIIAPAGLKDQTGAFLPEGLEHIGKEAFAGCSLLETVTLPSTIKTIGDRAFNACYRLSFFSVPATVEDYGLFPLSDLVKPRYFNDPCNDPPRDFVLRIRRDGADFDFTVPIPSKGSRHSDAIDHPILDLLFKKEFISLLPPPQLIGVLLQALENGYLTEEDILKQKERLLGLAVFENGIDVLRYLSEHTDILRNVPETTYHHMIDAANQRQHYEIQVMLMDAMRKYIDQEKASDISRHFQL